MAKRTVVLTGASSGIGAAAAIEFARRGDHLVLVGRTPDKLAAVVGRVRQAAGTTPDSYVCDFAHLDEVRSVGARIAAAYDVVDILANNAGLIAGRRDTTVDGHDVTIQVNHLAPWLLTHLLIDRVRAAEAGRIITTSSAAHVAGRLDPDDLNFRRRLWSRWRSYADSKQANILFTTELAWRLRASSAVPTCFHPGTVRSDFGNSSALFRRIRAIAPIGFVTSEQGAATLLYLADSDAGHDVPGGYFASCRLARPTRRATDPGLAARLWQVSAGLVGAS